MRGVAIGALLVAGGWAVWWHARPREAPRVEPSDSPTSIAPVVEGPPTATAPPRNPGAARYLPAPPAPSRTRYAVKPDGNVIEFNVVDGLAVAYGDVLLGKPDPDFHESHGNYEERTPQSWDRPEIAYAINPELPNPQRVEKALDYFRQHTVVKFVPYVDQRDALIFESGTENCLSYLGRVGGLQSIRLSPGCRPQEIMHEVMHALGFVHEQSRPDRDRYVDILWPNIEGDFQSQFAIVPDLLAEAERGSPFDYHSIMLYSTTAFAQVPGAPTMRAIGDAAIAPVSQGLSDGDLKRVAHLFGGDN